MAIIPAGEKKYNKAKLKFVGTAQWNWADSALLAFLTHLTPNTVNSAHSGCELFVERRKKGNQMEKFEI